MEADEARAQLERATAFVNARDLDAALDLLHPEVHFIPPGNGERLAYDGREEVRAFLAEWLEPWDAFHQEVVDVEMKGDRSLARVRVRARGAASGVEIDVDAAYVTEFDGDLIRHIEIFPSYVDAVAVF